MQNDLISRSALHKTLEEAQDGTRRIYLSLVDYRDKEVCKGELGTYARAKRMVEEAPTIDPESLRPKGKCKFCEDLDWMYDIVCYVPHDNGNATDIPVNYCPNCGAKMEV